MWSLILLSILLVVGGEVFGQFEVKLGNTDPSRGFCLGRLAAGITQISHISGVNLVGRSSHTYTTPISDVNFRNIVHSGLLLVSILYYRGETLRNFYSCLRERSRTTGSFSAR